MKIGIVGCGINGAYLAWKLSKENDVIVFEKNKTIGEKPCSSLVSERIWNFIPRNEKIIENTINEAIVHFPKKEVKIIFHPRMFVLNRKLLDQYIAELAEKGGAKIMLGNEVKKVFYIKGKKPQVSASGKIYEFDYLIGCDGSSSIVRKSIGIKEPRYKLGIYTYVNKRSKSAKVGVFPLKNGFAWIIPRGLKMEYGIIENLDVAKNEFQEFCKVKRLKPKQIFSHLIPEGLVNAEKERVAICGDSIGLTKPVSGGGILWGLIAADILIKHFPNFRKYNYKLKEFFEPKMLFSKLSDRIGRFIGNNIPLFLPKEITIDSDWIY
jgi:flavin-dependent dehydrogenase